MVPTVPEYLSQKLSEQYGEELRARAERGFGSRRPVTLRVNTLKSTREQVTRALENAGVHYESVPWYEDALILPSFSEEELRALPLYEEGQVYVQGLSAMVPALALDPQKGEAVLDMAAAPGGKTTQMAALSGGGALITACERNPLRAERLRFNLQRQGAGKVNVMTRDARQLDDLFRFDKILLDAPCTGSGTVLLLEGEPQRRMEPAWVKKTADTQRALLRKAAGLLSRGHEMVYSTCSVLREENEDAVRSLLSAGTMELVPLDPRFEQALPCLPVTLPGTLCVCPTELYEGFFVAKLRKR